MRNKTESRFWNKLKSQFWNKIQSRFWKKTTESHFRNKTESQERNKTESHFRNKTESHFRNKTESHFSVNIWMNLFKPKLKRSFALRHSYKEHAFLILTQSIFVLILRKHASYNCDAKQITFSICDI